ncbi:MAG: CvpA family protein [Proteobacteria bacterium]|nr:CvpA family protein [Pseudomonadota bacterium]MBU1708529.1 CvpA family protein [Pseudomonadota bacterium]
MNTFDLIVFSIFILFIAWGAWKGFISQTASILALVLGYAAVGYFYGSSTHIEIPFLKPQIGFIVSYCLIFLVVYFAVIFLGKLLKKVVSFALLGWADRGLGSLFGFIKAFIVVNLLFMLLVGTLTKSSPFLKNSFSFPYLSQSTKIFLSLIKDKDIRSRLKP